MRLAGVLGVLAVLLVPASAEAVRLPERGTVIVNFKGKRAAFVRDLRQATLLQRTVVMRKLPLAAVTGVRTQLRRVVRLDRVTHVTRNRRLRYDLHESAPLVFGGPGPQAATYAAGYDGAGVNVAVIDTGVDGLHPDLAERMVANIKVLGNGDAFEYVACPDGLPCNTDTSGGHGTHVAGIAVGDGTASGGFHRGVAPGAGLVGFSVGEAVTILTAAAAMDYILTHPELGIVAVNNSYGEGEGVLFDERMPVNVATRALARAGVSVVFSAGNAGPGPRTEPAGASDCSVESGGTGCKINQYGVAPWAISVANARSDAEGGPAAQPLSFGSSRGDERPQRSVTGEFVVDYQPTLTAPGTNVWAARTITGVAGLTCGASAEATSCLAYPQHLPFYVPISGTSMAAPHVTGAIAVLQSAAKVRLGRLLSPAEVEALLVRTARPMTALDGLWDFPCSLGGSCGSQVAGTTGARYEPWQVGAGFVDVAAAVAALPAPAPTPAPGGTPEPSPVASPEPTPGASPEPSPRPSGDRTAPVLRVLKVRRGRLRLQLSEPANVRLDIARPGRNAKTILRSLPAGRSVVRARALRRDRTVILVAADLAGNLSREVVA